MILDHLVLVVNELAAAGRHFERLGFKVIPGGEHQGWGTHNALIVLADGSYLELLAATRPRLALFYRLLDQAGALALATRGRSPIHQRFIRHLAAGEGLADFALLSDDLQADLQGIQARGLHLQGPLEGGRLRPDGQQVSWRTAVPDATDLPFLIEDLTPRELRVPSGGGSLHPNGVSSVAALSIACRDLDHSVDRYQRLLGLAAMENETCASATPAGACFRLANTDMVLTPAQVKLAMRKRRAAPLAISLRSSPSSNRLSLRFSPHSGYLLEPLSS